MRIYRPLQHRIWDLPNQLGLSSLVGQAELKTVIKVMVNLDVPYFWGMPPNPMALLDSPWL